MITDLRRKQCLDKLLKEAGVQPRRKGNAISELFSPYGPHAYDGYLAEYMAKRHTRKVKMATLKSDSESE